MPIPKLRTILRATAAVAAALALAVSPARASTTVGGTVAGTTGYYGYSDSVLRDPAANTETHWWCGDLPGHTVDEILMQQYSFTGGVHVTVPERAVLQEGPAGSWDSMYTCNPSVVHGSFANPLGNGVTYAWALYYVGTSQSSGTDNSIGVAFSNDGETWAKYPTPVLATSTSGGLYYGVGQPNAYDPGGGSGVTLLYESTGAPGAGQIPVHLAARPGRRAGALSGVSHLEATSTDGVHFTAAGTLSSAGLANTQASWGGAAYDPQDGRWYAAFNDDPTRPAATTGGVAERGQPGVTLYATSDLLAGTWQQLDTVDTNTTGYEANFIAALLRQPDGSLYGPLLPSVELYASTSVPRPAANASPAQRGSAGAFNNWQIAWSQWTPAAPQRALSRYYSSSLPTHEVTTGWVDTGLFHLESVLGHLEEAPMGQFTKALYGCVQGSDDYFVSADAACEGQLTLGLDGYISPAPFTGSVELYRCYSGDHFVSTDPACEHTRTEEVLGYAAP